MPNDEVEGVIKACPKDKLDDLVFVQVNDAKNLNSLDPSSGSLSWGFCTSVESSD